MIQPDARGGRKRWLSTDSRLLEAFVASEGPVSLKKLEEARGDECTMSAAVRRFHKLSRNWMQNDAWYELHDVMWMVRQGDYSTGLISDILEKYPEPDPGPRDSWVHTLLQTSAYDEIFHEASETYFKCDRHAASWGYAFWDRARLDRISGRSLPTLEEMTDVSDFILLETTDMLFYAKFRTPRECTCPPDY